MENNKNKPDMDNSKKKVDMDNSKNKLDMNKGHISNLLLLLFNVHTWLISDCCQYQDNLQPLPIPNSATVVHIGT